MAFNIMCYQVWLLPCGVRSQMMTRGSSMRKTTAIRSFIHYDLVLLQFVSWSQCVNLQVTVVKTLFNYGFVLFWFLEFIIMCKLTSIFYQQQSVVGSHPCSPKSCAVIDTPFCILMILYIEGKISTIYQHIDANYYKVSFLFKNCLNAYSKYIYAYVSL